MKTQHISEAYDCPLTKKHVHVQVQLKQNSRCVAREPEVCSNIGECGCGVVQIIYGMSYKVDWKKCCLYPAIKEQKEYIEN